MVDIAIKNDDIIVEIIPEALDIEEVPVASAAMTETLPLAEEVVQKEIAPKKKAGRPVGAKSKQPGRPRAPRTKKVVQIQEEEEAIEAKEEELPRVLPGSQPIPREAHNKTAALMLQLLQQQAQSRQTRKQDRWKSWFQ